MARMYRIAISGHRGLPGPTARLVDKAIRVALAECAPDMTGISCLADGADQISVRAVTDLGGTLEVVIPAAEYREGLPMDSHPGYDDLFAQAAAVRRLPFTQSASGPSLTRDWPVRPSPAIDICPGAGAHTPFWFSECGREGGREEGRKEDGTGGAYCLEGDSCVRGPRSLALRCDAAAGG